MVINMRTLMRRCAIAVNTHTIERVLIAFTTALSTLLLARLLVHLIVCVCVCVCVCV